MVCLSAQVTSGAFVRCGSSAFLQQVEETLQMSTIINISGVNKNYTVLFASVTGPCLWILFCYCMEMSCIDFRSDNFTVKLKPYLQIVGWPVRGTG